MALSYDFSGWATRNDLKCSDGRTIRRNAFKDCDGKTVPLVWMHDHGTPDNVLGHALLENRDSGVYAYCSFNDSPEGQHAKELVKHGDVNALSIYANRLTQTPARDVLHGQIREVSLVLAGANPGAFIDNIAIEHGEGILDDEAVIYTGEPIDMDGGEIEHADEPEDDLQHEDGGNDTAMADTNETVGDVIDTLNDKQKTAVYKLLGAMLDDDDDDEGDDSEEDDEVKHNVFDNEDNEDVISHADVDSFVSDALADAKKYGSLKDSVLAHEDAQSYGISNIDMLFPDYRNITNTPQFIKRETAWVSKVMNGVHSSPFSRIKSQFADITADAARAKGYMKGKLKKEEVFSLLKRTTDPQTIYKKQKLDRDDILDITDFDVVAWIKGEMRIMLDEEIARAILVGDGRMDSDDDKISEQHIRPISKDAELYTITVELDAADATAAAKDLEDTVVIAMDDYKGAGNPTCFIRQDVYTRCLLKKDTQGYRLYKSPSELATAMMVKELVPVPNEIMGDNFVIVVNLNDYNVGADKGGSVSMFDDFDIDYNQQKYLIETRCSGALTVPKSAIVVKEGTPS